MAGEAGVVRKNDQKEVIWWTGEFSKQNNMCGQSPAAYGPWICNLVSIRMKTSVRSTRERALKDAADAETLQENPTRKGAGG